MRAYACRELFAMPNRAMGENMFYSFDLGPLHVLAYNTGRLLAWGSAVSLGLSPGAAAAGAVSTGAVCCASDMAVRCVVQVT